MPSLNARPANHTAPIADKNRMITLRTICQVGMDVNPMRSEIVIGAVSGKRLMAIASGLFGFWINVVISIYGIQIGMVNSAMNCWPSLASVTVAPIDAINPEIMIKAGTMTARSNRAVLTGKVTPLRKEM